MRSLAGLLTYFSMASASVPSLSFSMNAIGKSGPQSNIAMATEGIFYCRYIRTAFGYDVHSELTRYTQTRERAELSPGMAAQRVLRLVIMGPPGAGKGTISGRISSTFKLAHLSSGDILRTHVSQQTALGREAQHYMSSGLLVPDSIMVSLILDSIREGNQRWLLDGFPRTLQQAEALSQHITLDRVINLNVPSSTIIDRIKGRWIHMPSGRVYHDEYNPPQVTGLDDHTGEELSQRPDDHPTTVQERLSQYDAQTRPVLDFYEQNNILQSFSGTESDVLWPQIKNYLHTNFHAKYHYQ